MKMIGRLSFSRFYFSNFFVKFDEFLFGKNGFGFRDCFCFLACYLFLWI